MKSQFILASGSPRRKALLQKLDVPFEVIPSSVQECHTNAADPAELVQQLALEKAREVAQHFPDRVVIGADTVVVLGDTVMGKPAHEAEAKEMLRALSGNRHTVFTGVAIVKKSREEKYTFYEKTDVTFLPLTNEMIDYYIRSATPLDKAGAYGIQDWSACFVEKINGCYNNVVGFPISKFAQLLRTAKIQKRFSTNSFAL
ncbi:MAG: Maf family protein [Candidatus Marinimicrobia bacterium]|nr:Maf family protein [Candidatus Neomarinimicrobiota bacterium]MDP6593936.1 Maf family protein [Candidatus Neomarinimicrobiota bacterium]MDP6966549.1 Maf family protein [Candidatus Neomarinimicrobiota bacterium]